MGTAVAVFCAGQAMAAERHFDFSAAKVGEPPPGFRSTVTGEGKPGDWRILEEEVDPVSSGTRSSVTTKRRVLAQVSGDITDEHFPLLVFEGEAFRDFTLTTRFKTVSGAMEQMAGLAFRIQDEKNYYVVRASSLGNSLKFYKFVDGVRSPPLGPEIAISRGAWHELAVDCKGNQIRCLLNGRQAIPDINDTSFTEGKIGFWTKSDSVSHFTEARIVYVPKVTLAKRIVQDTLREHPRLLGLKIFATAPARDGLHIVASGDETDVGQPAGTVEQDVVARDVAYYGKEKGKVIVSLPLHDRNGDAVAAVRVIMKSFPGQTEQNALARATPIVKTMERNVRAAKDLTQ